MDETLAPTLKEIADPLHRSLEQGERLWIARENDRRESHAASDAFGEGRDEFQEKMEARREATLRKSDKQYQEQREFEAKLLLELVRHNEVMERVARHLEGQL